MGMHRAQLLQGIIYRMTHLRVIVEQSNQLNLQDINVHAENFFRDLLNLAFDYDLQNINIVEPNATAIDLGCDSSRIAIQVTSTPDLSKIKHTFDRFTGKGLQTKYDRLVMLIVGQKKNIARRDWATIGLNCRLATMSGTSLIFLKNRRPLNREDGGMPRFPVSRVACTRTEAF